MPNAHDPLMKRADEIRDVMFERFSELLPTLENYFLLINTASTISDHARTNANLAKKEHVDALFDLISEHIARAEHQTGVSMTKDQIINRCRKDIEDDIGQLLAEEQSHHKGSGRSH